MVFGMYYGTFGVSYIILLYLSYLTINYISHCILYVMMYILCFMVYCIFWHLVGLYLKVLEKCTKNLIGHSRLAFNNHESNIDC